jgi:hypothetical protein
MVEVERRRTRRFSVSLPVLFRGDTPQRGELSGVTRDVSSAGAYIYMDGLEMTQDASVDFVLELPPEITLAAPVKVLCTARVVRVDRSGGDRTGLALQIKRYQFLGTT